MTPHYHLMTYAPSVKDRNAGVMLCVANRCDLGYGSRTFPDHGSLSKSGVVCVDTRLPAQDALGRPIWGRVASGTTD